MPVLIHATIITAILNALILILTLFLILLVLIQKGKGGGLSGAFGGAGGSSAFGSRAGDQFTKFTLIIAGVWILLIMAMVLVLRPDKRPQPAEIRSSAIQSEWRLARTDRGPNDPRLSI